MTDQSLIDRYAESSTEQLNDMLDKTKPKLTAANAVQIRHGLHYEKNAMETSSIRFYNLQMVLRHRGEK